MATASWQGPLGQLRSVSHMAKEITGSSTLRVRSTPAWAEESIDSELRCRGLLAKQPFASCELHATLSSLDAYKTYLALCTDTVQGMRHLVCLH